MIQAGDLTRPPSVLRQATRDKLAHLALQALREGDAGTAFVLADRWCRQAEPHVPGLLLRAKAGFKLGFLDYALQDLERALEIDPDNAGLNQCLLDRGTDEQRSNAAGALLSIGTVPHEQALAFLSRNPALKGAARLAVDGRRVSGWAAWRRDCIATLRLGSDPERTIVLEPDPQWAVASSFGSATCIDVAGDAPLMAASITIDDEVIFEAMIAAPRPMVAHAPLPPAALTVLVPVYEDVGATRACLQSLNAALLKTPKTQVLMINDGSPNPEIRELVQRVTALQGWHLRENPNNQGFVATVNAGLALINGGDVLLLNADTIVSPELLLQMRAVARRDPKIGTINPLSNNGEFVSFPHPMRNNHLDPKDLDFLFSSSALVNTNCIVDIPSGTGFCLYITRACLDAVGGLSTHYTNGYLEDADFGLRARMAGFRNVCAPSMFVAHLGSRSFRGTKAALVARNRKVLARRFPDYDQECRAFLKADPLRAARGRIEALWTLGPRRRVLLGPYAARHALHERARQLRLTQDLESLLLLIRKEAGHYSIEFRASGAGAPKSLRHNAIDLREGVQMLRKWPIERIEVAGHQDLPEPFLLSLVKQFRTVDCLLVEAVEPSAASRPQAPFTDTSAGARKASNGDAGTPTFLGKCASLIALDPMGAALASNLSKPGNVTVQSASPGAAPATGAPRAPDPESIGILVMTDSAEVAQFLLALAPLLTAARQRAYVFGDTSLSERLISRGLFVAGRVAPAEIDRVVQQYGIGRLIVPDRRRNHWLLQRYREAAYMPAAYFDYSEGGYVAPPGDLLLNAQTSDVEVARQITAWVATGVVS